MDEQLEIKIKNQIKTFIEHNISFTGDEISIKGKIFDLVDGFYLLLQTLPKKE